MFWLDFLASRVRKSSIAVFCSSYRSRKSCKLRCFRRFLNTSFCAWIAKKTVKYMVFHFHQVYVKTPCRTDRNRLHPGQIVTDFSGDKSLQTLSIENWLQWIIYYERLALRICFFMNHLEYGKIYKKTLQIEYGNVWCKLVELEYARLQLIATSIAQQMVQNQKDFWITYCRYCTRTSFTI